MTEPEFLAAVSSGKVDTSADDSATAEPAGGAPLPLVEQVSLAQFLPILLQLQSVQRYLAAAPTFVPQTFQDQIQFVYDGTTYYLYLYINNQWSGLPLTGSSSASINALATGCQNNLSSGANTQVHLGGASFANGVTWDPTGYQLIIQTAGQYLLTGGVDEGSSVATTVYSAWIEVNGSVVVNDSRYITGNNRINNSCNTLADLAVGDKVTLWMRQDSGFTNTLNSAYLGIAKV